MNIKERILIVEDDMIIAANISLQLTTLGYEVTGIETRGEEAISHAFRNRPDIILMDIQLKGMLSGIETARQIKDQMDIPVIYLTANNDEATFEKARDTSPLAFLTKPYSTLTLRRTLELVSVQLQAKQAGNRKEGKERYKPMDDRIFVRHNGKQVKLLLQDILYIEAERNYCNIVTVNGRFLVVATLKSLEEELPGSEFLRVHRSYLVNAYRVDGLADHHLEIGRKVIPVGKSYREVLNNRLHFI